MKLYLVLILVILQEETTICMDAALANETAMLNTKKLHYDIKLHIYFDVYNPRTMRFFYEQLLRLALYPEIRIEVWKRAYGSTKRVKKNGKWTFTCKKGPVECEAKKILACLFIDQMMPNTTDRANLFYCFLEKSRHPFAALHECGEVLGISARTDRIRACAQSDQGSNRLAFVGDQTDKIIKPFPTVPVITINNKYCPAIQKQALYDLRTLLCSQALPNIPSACTPRTTTRVFASKYPLLVYATTASTTTSVSPRPIMK